MTQTEKRSECKTMCWIIAAIAGLVLMLLLYKFIGLGGFWSCLLGLIGGLLLAYFLPRSICRDAAASADAPRAAALDVGQNSPAVASAVTGDTGVTNATVATPETAASEGAAETADGEIATGATDSDTPSAAPLKAVEIKPSTALAGEAELAARKGTWKYEAPAVEEKSAVKSTTAKATAAVTPAEVEPAKGAAAKKAAPKAAAKKAPAKTEAKAATKASAKTPAKKAPAKTAAKRTPVAADGKPLVYDAPPAEGSDDLKLISGVGPKLQQTLNELGIYRFDQVAGWRKKEIEWVDARLRFKGRIKRDDWMSQAKILAKGGETEFSKRKKT